MKKASHTKSLVDWLKRLEPLRHQEQDLGLERIKQVVQNLNLQAFHCPVITIGGTNGKGSCIATLEAIYLHAGYQVGAYTSPHILHFNERIRINGKEVADNIIINALETIERARGDIFLSFFEFITLAGLLIFQQTNLDIVLLEVGIGGRFDAVNIIDADVAVIASVDLDHTEWLGDSREKIGFEKAGILRQGKYAVCGDFNPPQSILDYAAKVQAELFCQGRDFYFNVDNLQSIWDWHGPHVFLHALPFPHLAMQNVSTALMAYCCLAEKLPVSHQALTQAIKSVRVIGRFQQIKQSPRVIIDVAHNPAAAFMLSQRLKQELSSTVKIIAVFSALNDKDISTMVEHLSEQVTAWYIAPLASKRSRTLDDLHLELQRGGATEIKKFDNITSAYQNALLHSDADNCIIVFGSFYTVAEVLIFHQQHVKDEP